MNEIENEEYRKEFEKRLRQNIEKAKELSEKLENTAVVIKKYMNKFGEEVPENEATLVRIISVDKDGKILNEILADCSKKNKEDNER